MASQFSDFLNYSYRLKVINTHSHHKKYEEFSSLDLDSLLKSSYVDWLRVPFDNSRESRKGYLQKVRFNSYFMWLEKSLRNIYGFENHLTEENWDEWSDAIKHSHSSIAGGVERVKKLCNYERVIVDKFMEPGSNNDDPDLFTPTYRINFFMFGYHPEVTDHNGTSPLSAYKNKGCTDMDEYIHFVRQCIIQKKAEGCVALKSALAYDRTLDIRETSREKARKAMGKKPEELSEDDIKAFQDYVFYQICRIAAELDLPLQCHTGLGVLKGSKAVLMREVIEKNPDTRFVLFHGSYPWLEDIHALIHNYQNVYPDLCWLPLLSTTAAARMLHELLEVGTSDKICWGCDTHTWEESYGALLAVRHVLAEVMAERVQKGYISREDAGYLMEQILYNNAKNIYKL